MNDFKVTRDETLDFKGGKIYVMQIRDGDKHAVEISDKNQTFGRLYVNDKIMAESILLKMLDRMLDFDKKSDADEFLKKCFQLRTLSQVLFMLEVYDKDVSQATIGRLTCTHNFAVSSKLGYQNDARARGAITIYVYFGDSRKPFGRFSGKRFGQKFKFEKL